LLVWLRIRRDRCSYGSSDREGLDAARLGQPSDANECGGGRQGRNKALSSEMINPKTQFNIHDVVKTGLSNSLSFTLFSF
jgi:hypothetical protein